MKKLIYIFSLVIILSSCDKILMESEPTDDPITNFEHLWTTADEKYSFFDYKDVDWDAVYPVKTNASLTDYPDGSELSTAAKDFQSAYSKFLADIEYAFDGYPQYLIPAVGGMFRLKDRINSLIRNPIPTMDGVNAAPIFRLD